MSQSQVAAPYAKALMEVAQAQNSADKVQRELEKVKGLITQSDEFRQFLSSPVLSDTDRRAVVEQVARRQLFSRLTTNFLLLLADRRRLGALEAIVTEFGRLADLARGIVRANVTSPAALSAVQVSRLRAALEDMTGKKVEVESSVDDSLIGGLVVKMEGKVYDNSVKTQLAVLKDNVRRI